MFEVTDKLAALLRAHLEAAQAAWFTQAADAGEPADRVIEISERKRPGGAGRGRGEDRWRPAVD